MYHVPEARVKQFFKRLPQRFGRLDLVLKAFNIHHRRLPVTLNVQAGLPYHFTDSRDRQLKLSRHLANSLGRLRRRAECQFVFFTAFEGQLDRIGFPSSAAEISDRSSDRQQFSVDNSAALAVFGNVTEVRTQPVAYVDHCGCKASKPEHPSSEHSRGRNEVPLDRSLYGSADSIT